MQAMSADGLCAQAFAARYGLCCYGSDNDDDEDPELDLDLEEGQGETFVTHADDSRDGSSSLVEVRINKLHNMGFQMGSIQSALIACGDQADENTLLDFILGQPLASSSAQTRPEEELKITPHQETLRTMGFSFIEVQAALESCGDKAPLETLIAYIAAASSDPSDHDSNRTSSWAQPPEECIRSGHSSLVFESQQLTPYEKTLRTIGFSASQIREALKSCGDDAPLETFIAYLAAASSDPPDHVFNGASGWAQPPAEYKPSDHSSLIFKSQQLSPYEETLRHSIGPAELLERAGYAKHRIEQALRICGNADISVLMDFIAAAEVAFEDDREDEVNDDYEDGAASFRQPKKQRTTTTFARGDMTGFGIPGGPWRFRFLSAAQKQPPFFYFENVSGTVQGAWEEISCCLEGIEPEFVDAKHFSVASRPRGYVHNLPLEGRFELQPVPPKTIQQFFPDNCRFFPSWDDREKLNCINTHRPPATTCQQIQDLMQRKELGSDDKRWIMGQCKKLNLIWTGPGTCAPLQEHEIERAMGYPPNHTRGPLNRTQQTMSLGNAFQVDTVGYHLSALKPLFPNGIRVLSLFSGIGGAEVALHRAGFRLNYVVSVELEAHNRRILANWWKRSSQQGRHRILSDVRVLSRKKLQELMKEAGGGFDLVIGGSPCNNLSGNNRATRTGLKGEHSSLFYEFPGILNLVRDIMRQQY